MKENAEEYYSRPRGKAALLVAIFLAPLMFLVHELVTYIFVPWACNAAGKVPIYLMNSGSLVVAAVGVYVAWTTWGAVGRHMTWELGGAIGRTRFLAFTATLFSSLFFLAIIATAVPNWIMDACHP